MLRAITVILTALMMVGCELAQVQESPLRSMRLTQGMPRIEAERLIAESTGRKSAYDIRAMDTASEVRYRDGRTILVVKYKPGAPAPLIKNNDGLIEGLPPIDAKVISWTWESEP